MTFSYSAGDLLHYSHYLSDTCAKFGDYSGVQTCRLLAMCRTEKDEGSIPYESADTNSSAKNHQRVVRTWQHIIVRPMFSNSSVQ